MGLGPEPVIAALLQRQQAKAAHQQKRRPSLAHKKPLVQLSPGDVIFSEKDKVYGEVESIREDGSQAFASVLWEKRSAALPTHEASIIAGECHQVRLVWYGLGDSSCSVVCTGPGEIKWSVVKNPPSMFQRSGLDAISYLHGKSLPPVANLGARRSPHICHSPPFTTLHFSCCVQIWRQCICCILFQTPLSTRLVRGW